MPMSAGADRADPSADRRRVLALFPARGDATAHGALYEDDGVSVDAPHSLVKFSLVGRGDSLDLDWLQMGAVAPVLNEAAVILPEGEHRALTVRGTPVARGATITL